MLLFYNPAYWKKLRGRPDFCYVARLAIISAKEPGRMKLVTFAILILLVFALLPHPVHAQAASPSPASAASSDTNTSAPTSEYTLPPDKLAKAKALYDINGTLRIVGTVWGFVVLLGILYLGIAAKYRDWAEKASRYSFVQAMIAVPLFLLTLS